MLDDFSFSPEDASRRDLKREGGDRRGRQLPHSGRTRTLISLSLSLNLVINYEREIIINICLPGVRPRPSASRPSMRTSSGRIWIGIRRCPSIFSGGQPTPMARLRGWQNLAKL